MKVIATDNYCRELPDRIIRKNLTPKQAKDIAKALNLNREDDEWLYKAVEDDYKLFNVD